MSTENDTEILFNSQRNNKLWFVLLICISVSVFLSYFILILTDKQLLQDFDSLYLAKIWQVFMLLVANSLTLFMLWFGGRYVLQISRLENGNLLITTWHPFYFKYQKEYSKDAWAENIVLRQGKFFRFTTPYFILNPQSNKNMIIDLNGVFPQGIDELKKCFVTE